jgi:hypothetical protein
VECYEVVSILLKGERKVMTELSPLYFILNVSVVLNLALIVKYISRNNLVNKQKKQIRRLENVMRNWQYTHSACIEGTCMDKILDDIIGDMK